MSPHAYALLGVLVAITVLYEFVNGFHDGANIVSTMIASRAMSARGALLLAASCSFAGPFFVGGAVSQTLGAETLNPGALTIAVALAAMAAATAWNLVTWWLRIPVSSSHALVGGLLGAAFASGGTGAIRAHGLVAIAAALLLSPLLGLAAAWAIMALTLRVLRNATPRAGLVLSRLQIATASALAFTNGANDGHKTAAVIALGMVLLGLTPEFAVPWWALVACAAGLSLGTIAGGERIVQTLGARFYRIRPIHGFAAQAASAAVLMAANVVGGPVSSTQIASMAIVGAGAAERRSKVRWSALTEIGVAWLITVPATAALALPLQLAFDALLRRGGS